MKKTIFISELVNTVKIRQQNKKRAKPLALESRNNPNPLHSNEINTKYIMKIRIIQFSFIIIFCVFLNFYSL